MSFDDAIIIITSFNIFRRELIIQIFLIFGSFTISIFLSSTIQMQIYIMRTLSDFIATHRVDLRR